MLLLPVHIAAGLVALTSGAVSMIATKGGKLHRQSGMVFVCAMWVMSAIGTGMAELSDEKGTVISVVAGTLTFYLVSTAFLTVRRTVQSARGWNIGFMLLALVTGASAMRLGLIAVGNTHGNLDGVPAAMYFVFGSVALLAGLLDARMLLVGSIEGAHRLARHLWRMSFAMWIATSSFFLGQAKLFPEPIRKSGLLAIPVLLVIVFLVYWLVRVLWKRRSAVSVQVQ